MLSLLWGGVRTILHIAKSYNDFFESIVGCVYIIGTNLARIGLIEHMFSGSDSLRTSLEELYYHVLTFCLDAKQLFADTKAKKKRNLIPKRLRTMLQALWSSFSAQFEQTREDIENLIDRIDKEAVIAGLDAARANQDQQNQWWAEQDAERDAASQHRLKDVAEMERQLKERGEQAKWRSAETILWQEQKAASTVLTNFVVEETRLQICQWLSNVDTDASHEIALSVHHPGTCAWILHTMEFKQWLLQEKSVLWVHAIPGAGKTILSSSTIECIQSTLADSEALTYYYFDYKSSRQQSLHALLSTLLSTLISKYPSFFTAVEAQLKGARAFGRAPTDTMLRSLLLEATSHFSQLYVVVDALDECTDQDALFKKFFDLPQLSKGKIKLFVTSRQRVDIQKGFASIPHLSVEMKESLVQPDIRIFVEAEVGKMIQRQQIKLRDQNLRSDVTRVLSEKAEGMFQWVKCQLDQLRRLKSDKAIRISLNKLPKGLEETYLRLLQQLMKQSNEDKLTHIQRLLRWLVHSARPLTAEELAEAIAIDIDQIEYDESAALTDPLDLLEYGESLIVLKSGRIQLSHFSVREFLVSDVVRNEAPSFYMGILEANAEIATICLTYLNFSNFDYKFEDINKETAPSHLLTYACSEWAEHYRRVQDYQQRPKHLISRLLSMEPISQNFLHLCRSSAADIASFTPLHYCAMYGLIEQLKQILDDGYDLNLDADPYGSPLNCAVRYDRIEVIRHLVDRGADPNCSKITPSLEHGNNSLHWALDENHVAYVSLEIVEILCDAAADIGVNTMGGLWHSQMPIHYAARANRLDIMKTLIKYGANIDAVDLEGHTPLAIAVDEGAIHMASYLLEQGASLYTADGELTAYLRPVYERISNYIQLQGNHCDSIRESPVQIDALIPTMSGAYWDVVTTLKSHGDAIPTSGHWGFALGAAAREGRLDPLRQLLDLNISSQAFGQLLPEQEHPNDRGNSAPLTRLTNIELEGRIGTMFSALTPAILGGHLEAIGVLLERMLHVLTAIQTEAMSDLSCEIHQLLVYDQDDSMFCKVHWNHSSTYVAILIGYLRTAKLTIDMQTDPHASLKVNAGNALHILVTGWPDSLRAQPNGHEDPLNYERTAGPPDPAEISRGPLSFAQHQALLLSGVRKFCERARIFWHSKRNTRKALHSYLSTVHPLVSKREVLKFLLHNGCDVNSLDRAGRTPLYWASVFANTKAIASTSTSVNASAVCDELIAHGGLLYAPSNVSLARLRTSILIKLNEMVTEHQISDVNAIDLSRKSDWNALGRYFYFAQDFQNATKAFETSAVFDSQTTVGVPAYHYFFCDECSPGDYRDETLIHGYRFVVRDSLDSDLCQTCRDKYPVEALRIPSQKWVKEKQEAHAKMILALQEIDRQHLDSCGTEKAKNESKKLALVARRTEMLRWVKEAKMEWEADDTALLLARYTATKGAKENAIEEANITV